MHGLGPDHTKCDPCPYIAVGDRQGGADGGQNVVTEATRGSALIGSNCLRCAWLLMRIES